MPSLKNKEELLFTRERDSIESWSVPKSPIKYLEEKITLGTPSIRQMMREMNLRSPAPIQIRLERLRAKGYINWMEKEKSPIALSRTSGAEEREEIEKIFDELVKQWREETRGISSTTELAMHPAYQQIIGMGEKIIPLLLRELERKTGRWFWALKSITREDPVPPEKRGKTKDMIEIWLNWGREKGYQW